MSSAMRTLGVIVLVFYMASSSEGSSLRNTTGQFTERIRNDPAFAALPPNVSVDVRLMLTSVNEVNTDQGFVDLDGWLYMSWMDEKLRAMFRNVTDLLINTIHIPPDTKLWRPDMLLYNDHAMLTKMKDVPLVLKRAGSVTWIPPIRIVANCAFRPASPPSTPLNSQRQCSFKFGSWTYDGFNLNLTSSLHTIDTGNFYIENPHWRITNTTARVEVNHYSCCPNPYPTVNFSITLVPQ